MAYSPPISISSPQATAVKLTNVPSSPSAESTLSFTSASDISNGSFVGVEHLAQSAAMDQSPPSPFSFMENTPLVRHSDYYMQNGMADFQVSQNVHVGYSSGA